MGAPLEFCSKRGVVAVLASGVVISLTALTGGIAPAFAKPGDDPSGPTTTVVVPEPEQPASEPEETAPERKAPEPKPEPKSEVPTQAPQAPVVPEVPVAPVAPATPAEPATPASPPSVQSPPKTQVTEAPASEASEPATQAPKASSSAVAPPVTSVQTAEPSQSEPSSAARTPAGGSEEPSSAETSAQPSKPSAAFAPESESESESESSKAPATRSSDAPTSESASRESEAEQGTSEKPTVSVREAAKEIKTVEPQTVDAPAEDVQLARAATPIFEPQPAAATTEDVASFSNGIETSLKIPGLDIGASAKTQFAVERRDVELVSPVRQWRSDWIDYDEYYRPIVLNPFHNPVRLVYMYESAPRIVIIPPLARMVIEAARYAAYSFTAAVLAPVVAAVGAANAVIDTAQALTNIAVGSFFGGGYFPGVGLPLPPPPPPVLRYDNVPVFVNYSQAQYEPFRVRQIVDVGDDPQFGERKVLLDGSTPAWGRWTQSPTGERQFEIHKTQQFPGLDAPAEAPLPGDYKLRLLSDEAPDSGFTSRDIFLFVAAGVIGTLGVGAIGMAFYLGRRRPQH